MAESGGLGGAGELEFLSTFQHRGARVRTMMVAVGTKQHRIPPWQLTARPWETFQVSQGVGNIPGKEYRVMLPSQKT